ncbi:methyltransferase, FxLD system [Dactylosporangium sp. CA-233914]|uniref:methyltransferase, FxLD system n=1 Tax=Dactylosporangium sp. CA-233914 TaxID=3239934 RepID=UPI003D91B6EE
MTDLAQPLVSAADLRARLADALIAAGFITTPAVEAAVRRVPREVFVPDGTDLTVAYANNIVVTKRGPDGKTTSSISAPWLQAYMLETARIRPAYRVLEIGSGGYNAALIAELVGPDGTVVSLDIDPQVVAHAQATLASAGYRQVRVVHADGEYGYAPGGPYDAILVTVETSDIPPAWTEQLAPDGILVAPVRMQANTRCLTLERDGDHLAATASLQCGFVPMQGDGQNPTRRLALRGEDAVLVLDDPTTDVNIAALRAALNGPRHDVWSPVTLPMDASFEALHLWLASQPRPYGVLNIDRERTAGLLDPQDRFFCPTLLTHGSFAYLTTRRHDDMTWQCGAHGFGPDATTLTSDLINLIAAWDRLHRAGVRPAVTVYPVGTALPPTEQLRLVVARRHTQIVITWPGSSRRHC